MIIRVPKEIKNNEYRVFITHSGTYELTKIGNEVWVQKDAGIDCGYDNDEYRKHSRKIVDSIKEIYNRSDMIVKVKEQIEQEYKLIKKNHNVFTYLYLSSNKKLVEILLDLGSVCIAYTAHPTTHLYPICIKQGIIYYCVANMPGIYSKTSTLALTNLTLRYVKKIAQKGIEKIFTDKDLIIGLYIYKGKITYKKIAGNLNMLDRYSKIIN